MFLQSTAVRSQQSLVPLCPPFFICPYILHVRHVPRVARPLLASALCREFSLSVRHGLWGFARVLLFPKLVLRSPPRAGRKKHYLHGWCFVARLFEAMDVWYWYVSLTCGVQPARREHYLIHQLLGI